MIGRNNPDSAALLGSQPPHRNSSDLVAMALRANALTGQFILDTLWDRPTHPEGWYFRSDHLPYARLNVPALMYSTNLHDDYHTPRDRPGSHRLPEAHAHGAVDVPDGVVRGERARAAEARSRIQAGALTRCDFD